MASNILITFLVSLLTLSGINTNTANINQKTTDATVINESVEAAGDTDYEEDDEVNDETDDEIADEDLMSIEEKYEHNKRNYTDDSDDTLVWYDAPYCDNHDFEVLGDETETMYICKKCGYSYSEFHENNQDESEDEQYHMEDDSEGSDDENDNENDVENNVENN